MSMSLKRIFKKIINRPHLSILILTLLLVSGLIGKEFALAVWTEPTLDPPAGNVAAPINVGAASQTKTGPLIVTERVTGAAFYDSTDPNYYVNPDGQSVFAGPIGIGTTAPGGKLHVKNTDDSYMIYGGTGNLSLYNSEAPTGEMRIGSAWNRKGIYSNNDMNILAVSGLALSGRGNNTDLYINTSGQVGIGTTAPSKELDVDGGLRVRDLASCNTIDTDSSGNFACGADETNDPVSSSELDNVCGTDGKILKRSSGTWICADDALGADNLGNHIATKNIQLDGNWLSGDGGNEGVYVTNDGEVGIGTSDPAQGAYKFRFGVYGKSYRVANFKSNSDAFSCIRFSTLDGNYAHIGVSNNGLYISGDNIGNQEDLVVTGDGKVGIGTTAPGYKLDVQGGQINTSGGLCIAGVCKSTWSEFGDTDWTISGNNMYSGVIGKVGIGTASPISGKLHIYSNVPGLDALYSKADMGNAGYFDGPVKVTGDLKVDGKVGIGTASPSEKLHVAGKLEVDGISYLEGDAFIGTKASHTISLYGATGHIGTSGNIVLGGKIASNNAGASSYFMGKLGLGMGNPTEKLDVNGNVKVSGNLNVIKNTNLQRNVILSEDIVVGGTIFAGDNGIEIGSGHIYWDGSRLVIEVN